jgi:hypothetical protein
MNNRQRQILARQIRRALTRDRRTISTHLASALLEMDPAHLQRLEREGLFPQRVARADGSSGYALKAIYEWLEEGSDVNR